MCDNRFTGILRVLHSLALSFHKPATLKVAWQSSLRMATIVPFFYSLWIAAGRCWAVIRSGREREDSAPCLSARLLSKWRTVEEKLLL
jgi:hypothetical protein